jgi:hypothetical protein
MRQREPRGGIDTAACGTDGDRQSRPSQQIGMSGPREVAREASVDAKVIMSSPRTALTLLGGLVPSSIAGVL